MSHPRVHQIEIRANMVIADVKEHCKLFEIQIEHSNVYMLQSLMWLALRKWMVIGPFWIFENDWR